MTTDSQLQQAVLDELSWEPSVTAGHIGVSAKGGVVGLSGHVGSFAEKFAAEMATRRVKGVKAVAEEIEVKLPFSIKRSDEQIAAAAIDSLLWDVSIPRDAVKVTVEKGWLKLTGEVEWQYQRNAAEQDVRRLQGVVGVMNEITIEASGVNTSTISDDIRHALHRTWFDPKTITVTAHGGRVKLSGTVHSWQDRQTAATTAWSAPGATMVENDITIN